MQLMVVAVGTRDESFMFPLFYGNNKYKERKGVYYAKK